MDDARADIHDAGSESSPPVSKTPVSTTTRVVAVVAGVATLGLGILGMPRPPQLGAPDGDAEIIAAVEPLLESGRHELSVAVIDTASVRTAHWREPESDPDEPGRTPFEIGSVAKVVTASLLVEAIERGEVEPTTTLGELLEVEGDAADVTLESLAMQNSGMPNLPSGVDAFLAGWVANLRAADPYPYDRQDLLGHATAADLGEPEYLYSNLGFALLGEALAAAADTEYDELVAERIFEPLGMAETHVPDEVSAEGRTGYTASGRSAGPWTMGSYRAAGGIRSTLDDMIAFTAGQLDGSAPGVDATRPRVDVPDVGRIGYAWYTTEGVTWHNGMTGGFAAWVGFDAAADHAVVVLSDSSIAVDAIGWALLEEGASR